MVLSEQSTYHSQVLDHLGLAVKAMMLNGLRFINQALYLVPRFFQNRPTSQFISPRMAPEQPNDDALGRALDTLYDCGVTALYSLIAAAAAKRPDLSPTHMHLDTTSFHVDGRYNSNEPPAK
jgi:transposase